MILVASTTGVLAPAVAEIRGLTWLNISHNPGLGAASLRLFAKLLSDKSKFKRLKEVRLAGHGGAEAKAALEKACKERSVTIVA